MSKHSGNRTGRQAKRRRRRHARRTSDAMHRLHLIVDGEPVRDWGRLSAALRIGIDLAAGPDRTVFMPARSGKTARMAEVAELLRSGRVVIAGTPPPELEEDRRPLTDSELALRYSLHSVFIDDVAPPEASSAEYRAAVRGWRGTGRDAIVLIDEPRDWPALPPKDGE